MLNHFTLQENFAFFSKILNYFYNLGVAKYRFYSKTVSMLIETAGVLVVVRAQEFRPQFLLARFGPEKVMKNNPQLFFKSFL